MKIALNLFFTIVVITSCLAQKLNGEKIFGKYQSKKGEPFTQLTLNKDNTFKYRQVGGLYDSKSEGTWELKNKKIVLTSDSTFKSGIIFSQEKMISDSKTKIIIFDDEDNHLAIAGVTVNNQKSIGWNTDDNGVVLIPRKDVSQISVYYLGEEYSYLVKDIGVNEITLKIRVNELSKTYFENEIFILKRDRLINEYKQVLKKL